MILINCLSIKKVNFNVKHNPLPKNEALNFFININIVALKAKKHNYRK